MNNHDAYNAHLRKLGKKPLLTKIVVMTYFDYMITLLKTENIAYFKR